MPPPRSRRPDTTSTPVLGPRPVLRGAGCASTSGSCAPATRPELAEVDGSWLWAASRRGRPRSGPRRPAARATEPALPARACARRQLLAHALGGEVRAARATRLARAAPAPAPRATPSSARSRRRPGIPGTRRLAPRRRRRADGVPAARAGFAPRAFVGRAVPSELDEEAPTWTWTAHRARRCRVREADARAATASTCPASARSRRRSSAASGASWPPRRVRSPHARQIARATRSRTRLGTPAAALMLVRGSRADEPGTRTSAPDRGPRLRVIRLTSATRRSTAMRDLPVPTCARSPAPKRPPPTAPTWETPSAVTTSASSALQSSAPRGRGIARRCDRAPRPRAVAVIDMSNTAPAGRPPSRDLRVRSARRRRTPKFIEHVLKTYRVIGSPGFDRDETLRDWRAAARPRPQPGGLGPPACRDHRPGDARRGWARSGSTVVCTAQGPPLARPAAAPRQGDPGRAARRIEGMGHDLPLGAWPQIRASPKRRPRESRRV